MSRHETAGQEAVHQDVAAYALGVLEPADAERYEQHLTSCANCALELEHLLPTSALLTKVEPTSLHQVDDPAVLDRLLDSIAVDRRRVRQRSRLTLVASTAVTAIAAGFALFAGSTWLAAAPGDQQTPAPPALATPPAGTGGSVDLEGERLTATDPGTGVQVEAQLTSWDWGTAVSFSLSTLTGPRDCELVLVYADGSEKIAGSWHVPHSGYGTPAHPSPLKLQAAVGGERESLVELKVVELLPGGSNRPLVTLPL